ncbi:MAG: hypothetical protein ACYC23_23805, partial [Limisphaerales bacterium]
MIVNRNYQRAAEASVTIARPGHRLQELDRQTGQWTRGEELGGTRTALCKLAPGDGRQFRMVEKSAVRQPTWPEKEALGPRHAH